MESSTPAAAGAGYEGHAEGERGDAARGARGRRARAGGRAPDAGPRRERFCGECPSHRGVHTTMRRCAGEPDLTCRTAAGDKRRVMPSETAHEVVVRRGLRPGWSRRSRCSHWSRWPRWSPCPAGLQSGAAEAAAVTGTPWEAAGPVPIRLRPARLRARDPRALAGRLQHLLDHGGHRLPRVGHDHRGGPALDFSANNLADHMASRLVYEGMAPSELAAAYYARWEGPVLESSDPYPRPGAVARHTSAPCGTCRRSSSCRNAPAALRTTTPSSGRS